MSYFELLGKYLNAKAAIENGVEVKNFDQLEADFFAAEAEHNGTDKSKEKPKPAGANTKPTTGDPTKKNN